MSNFLQLDVGTGPIKFKFWSTFQLLALVNVKSGMEKLTTCLLFYALISPKRCGNEVSKLTYIAQLSSRTPNVLGSPVIEQKMFK